MIERDSVASAVTMPAIAIEAGRALRPAPASRAPEPTVIEEPEAVT